MRRVGLFSCPSPAVHFALLLPVTNLTALNKAQLVEQLTAALERNAQLEAQATAAPAAAELPNDQRLVGLLKNAKAINRPDQPLAISAMLVHSSREHRRDDGSVIPAMEFEFDSLIANGETAEALQHLGELAWARIAVYGYWRAFGKPEPYTGKNGKTYYKARRQLAVTRVEVLSVPEPAPAQVAEPFSHEPTDQEQLF